MWARYACCINVDAARKGRYTFPLGYPIARSFEHILHIGEAILVVFGTYEEVIFRWVVVVKVVGQSFKRTIARYIYVNNGLCCYLHIEKLLQRVALPTVSLAERTEKDEQRIIVATWKIGGKEVNGKTVVVVVAANR
jgi:hypothetical protein